MGEEGWKMVQKGVGTGWVWKLRQKRRGKELDEKGLGTERSPTSNSHERGKY